MELYLTVMFTGLLVLFFTMEFNAIRRNHDSWDWVKKIYFKYKWIQKVKW